MSAQVDVDTSGAKWAFFNGGADFGLSIRLSSNVSFDVESGLEKALHRFAGRARPVEFAGTGTTRTVNLSGTLFAPWVAVTDEPSTWADIEALAMLPGPHCFRDPSGIRIFGSVAPAPVSYTHLDVYKRQSSAPPTPTMPKSPCNGRNPSASSSTGRGA